MITIAGWIFDAQKDEEAFGKIIGDERKGRLDEGQEGHWLESVPEGAAKGAS